MRQVIDVGAERASERGYLTLRGERLVFAVRPISQFHPHTKVVEQS
jgi:hypothetical protein